jgi:hypothetical protein
MKDLLTPTMFACLLLRCLTCETIPKAPSATQMWAASVVLAMLRRSVRWCALPW